MRVLITGGAGFIGSHLCDILVSRGESVVILDNLSTGSKENISHLKGYIEVIHGDIRDKDLVEKLIEKSDLVLHMAAALGVSNILENPIESISTNYLGSEVVLNACLKHDTRLIIASTSEIYGKNTKQPLSETDDRVIGSPQKLRWTYSDAKALEEASAYYYFLTKKLKVTTVRLFNTVGPRQTGKYGMVVPRFVRSALTNSALQVFGDGTQSRVFCHVADATNAIIQLAFSDKSIGEVFNIGGVGEVTIKWLAEKIITETRSSSIIKYVDYGQAYAEGYEDMARRVPDISKIKKFIDWEPKLSLEQVIHDVAEHLRYKDLGQP